MEEQKTKRTDEQITKDLNDSRSAGAAGKVMTGIGWVIVIIGLVTGPSIGVIIVGLLVLGVGHQLAEKKKKDAKQQIQDTVVPDVLQELLEEVHFEPDAHLGQNTVDESGIPLIRHTDVNGGEYAKGKYHGKEVELSSIRLSEWIEFQRDESEGGMWERNEETVYQGQWMVCHFETPFPVSMTIYPRGKLDKLFRTATIVTGNEKFDKRFMLSADDEKEALRFLGPTRMEKFLALADTAGGGISVGIRRDGTMYLAVQSGHGFFDPGKGREDAAAIRRRFTEELKWYLSMTDIFC